nr:flagellar assembly protein FliH [uncultured Oxalicibacterium sp.]
MLMSNLIPKEKQSAYQRWEMESFGDDRPSARQSTAAEQPDLQQLALQKQIDMARAQAHAEGLAAGLQEGRDAGRQEGYAAGLAEGRAAAEEERQQLLAIAETFGTEVAQANELIAADMLSLSLDVAKAMLKTALQVKPELVVPIVRESIHYLPTLQQPALLHLHPEDAALVSAHMNDELTVAGWRIVEDIHQERGGCRIETATNQVDASTSTRWQRIAAALGKESDWLDRP